MRTKFSTRMAIACGVAAGWMALLPAPVLYAGPDDRAADRAAIRHHIDAIFQAYMARDRAAVRATHAADWRGFLLGSRSTVRGIDEYMSHAAPYLEDDGPRMRGYEMREQEVAFFDSTAVIPYVATMEVEAPDGSVAPVTMRVLDVYAHGSDGWNQVASNTCYHAETLEAYRQQPRHPDESERRALLAARNGVWRAWFAGDSGALEAAIPMEFVGINWGGDEWSGRQGTIEQAAQFAAAGGRLVAVRFPRTEIQVYGDVAILYSQYEAEIEENGQVSHHAGRGTEVFVWRDDRWVNPGWHLDSGD